MSGYVDYLTGRSSQRPWAKKRTEDIELPNPREKKRESLGSLFKKTRPSIDALANGVRERTRKR